MAWLKQHEELEWYPWLQTTLNLTPSGFLWNLTLQLQCLKHLMYSMQQIAAMKSLSNQCVYRY